MAFGEAMTDVVITLNTNDNTIKATSASSGVAEIESEAGDCVYYNMQGVKVTDPVHGLYIRVSGNKAEKVIMK